MSPPAVVACHFPAAGSPGCAACLALRAFWIQRQRRDGVLSTLVGARGQCRTSCSRMNTAETDRVRDTDWSNAKGTGTADGWCKHKPMDDEEMLFKQVQMTAAATPGTTVWVSRHVIWFSGCLVSVIVTNECPYRSCSRRSIATRSTDTHGTQMYERH